MTAGKAFLVGGVLLVAAGLTVAAIEEMMKPAKPPPGTTIPGRSKRTSPPASAREKLLATATPTPPKQTPPPAITREELPVNEPTREPPPTVITLPVGLTLVGELGQEVRSDRAVRGQSFWLQISQPIWVNGIEIVPVGSRIHGQVIEANKSGRVKGRARLRLAFQRLEIRSATYPIVAEAVTREAKDTKKKDVAKIGTAAGIGAIIGAFAGGKKGAAAGAGAGAGVGTVAVLATKGKEVKFTRGETLSVKLVEPVVLRVQK